MVSTHNTRAILDMTETKVKSRRRVAIVLAPVLLQGCDQIARAPSIPIFGSYFPAWVLCAIGGIVVASLLRFAFVQTGINEHLIAPPLVYLSFAISAGIGLFLLWTGSS